MLYYHVCRHIGARILLVGFIFLSVSFKVNCFCIIMLRFVLIPVFVLAKSNHSYLFTRIFSSRTECVHVFYIFIHHKLFFFFVILHLFLFFSALVFVFAVCCFFLILRTFVCWHTHMHTFTYRYALARTHTNAIYNAHNHTLADAKFMIE